MTQQTLGLRPAPEERSDEWCRVHGTAITYSGTGQYRRKYLSMKEWSLYILQCHDGSLYTGITTDLEKRLKWHNEGRASKYTRSKRPVKLVYKEGFHSESSTRKQEAAIKKLSRQDKLELIK